MRIIAGAFRGRRLQSPKDKEIRPTIDRVREAVFSIIAAQVQGARALDLFAGTGAMGLEALSRGASFCIFVDQGAQALRLIRENIELCGAQEKSRLIQGTVSSVIKRLGAENEVFDLIFMDPPYGKGYLEEALELAESIAGGETLVIAEHHIKDESPQVSGIWQKDRERRYGDTLISVYSRFERVERQEERCST
jgi:16S rRNA (guanine(966)-N(2))-methyltransferase RsmD